jgi:eukaryotic-like serine/threonine-protein kinase
MASRPDPSPGSAAPVASAPAAEALVGQRVQKYDIVRIIGRGGMGTVYEALNTDIGKRVAMKFVDAEAARNKDSIARFQREAQAASAVESAHIVEIFDSGVSDEGAPYIVMELLRGEDLGHRIKRCGRLELGESVHVIAQILRGLHRAHEAGIVHRDLKPDNIFLVDRDDDPSFAKILDFGISKVARTGSTPVHTLTRQGTVLGTPFYMSPEQAQAQPDVDGRTDLWSVGAILYECLTGRPPYTGTTYEQVIVNICMHDADDVRTHNPGVPEAVAQVIARALARDREQRFPSARELLEALKASMGGAVSSRPELFAGPGDGSGSSAASNDFRLTPRSNGGGTPSPRASQGTSDPPIDVRPSAGTSKVGWSTSRREAARREKRTFLAVAVSALVAGAVGAFLYVRSRPADKPAEGTTTTATASEVTVELHTNVPGARFSVGGVEVPGGKLKGTKGQVKKVRVEADGYAPTELDVPLAEANEPFHILLASASPAPTVSPGADVPRPVDTARPADTAKAHDPGKPPIRSTPPAASASASAGKLQLKKE